MWRARSRIGSGQRRPRQSSTSALTARSRPVRRGPRRPRRAAPRGTRSTSASVVAWCSETRTLPDVSAPIATRTWDGSSVDDVHDDPDETANPRRSRPAEQRLAVHVQARERDDVRQPARPGRRAPRRRGSSATAARIRSISPVVACLHSPPGSRGSPAATAAAATIAGTFGSPGTRPPSRSSSGNGERHRVPARTASTPTAGAAPHPGVGGQDRPARRDRVVAQRLGRVDDERHAGRQVAPPRDRLGRADLVIGRLQRGARGSPCPRAAAANCAASTRPNPSTPTRCARPPRATWDSAACRTAECSTALCTKPARRVLPARVPRTAACSAWVPFGAEADLLGPGTDRVGDACRAESSSSPARRAGAVEPARVGPAVVQGGEQGLTRHRVQRRARRTVQIRAHGTTVAIGRDSCSSLASSAPHPALQAVGSSRLRASQD